MKQLGPDQRGWTPVATLGHRPTSPEKSRPIALNDAGLARVIKAGFVTAADRAEHGSAST